MSDDLLSAIRQASVDRLDDLPLVALLDAAHSEVRTLRIIADQLAQAVEPLAEINLEADGSDPSPLDVIWDTCQPRAWQVRLAQQAVAAWKEHRD
jgi:hypothetical protein